MGSWRCLAAQSQVDVCSLRRVVATPLLLVWRLHVEWFMFENQWRISWFSPHVLIGLLLGYLLQMTTDQAQDYLKRKGVFVQKQQQGVQKVSCASLIA